MACRKRALIGTDEQYTDEWYNQQREAANKDYDAAVAEANTLCSETLKILQDGYKDRADGLKTYSENQKSIMKILQEKTKEVTTTL